MRLTAIIAEYNPLHTGHLYQMEATKAAFPDDALCVVMSGNFTQRGDIAVAEKHKRAVAAVRAGADIVVELPFFYAANCAEKFADGAMKTLSCFNADTTVSFGSECGDLERLQEISARVHNETADTKKVIKEGLKKGEKLVSARAKAIGDDELFCPNNVLGIEYVRAAENYGFHCYTVRRESGYNDSGINGKFASANTIRSYITSGNISDISRFIPDFMLKELNNCIGNNSLGDILSYKIKTADDNYLRQLLEVSEGLENRVAAAAEICADYDGIINYVKSKRYTMARIKRIMLYILTGLTKSLAAELYDAPQYARVLAVKRGREDLLSSIQNCVVRYSDVQKLPLACQKAIALENTADDVYSVASKSPCPFNALFV